jgi:hypothetical protein
MQQQALESIWAQLSPLGQQFAISCLRSLQECSDDDYRRRLLEIMQMGIVLDNRKLEGSAVFHLCMQEISLATLNPVEEAERLVVEAEGVGGEADGIVDEAEGVGGGADGIVDEAEGLVVEVEGVGGGADGIVDEAEGNEAVAQLLNASMETFLVSSSSDQDSNTTSDSSLEEEFALDTSRQFF